MSVLLELAPEVEELAKAKAASHGVSLEDYLPSLVAQAIQQETWEENDASMATILGSEATMRRLWDTPEEDKAWKDFQGD